MLPRELGRKTSGRAINFTAIALRVIVILLVIIGVTLDRSLAQILDSLPGYLSEDVSAIMRKVDSIEFTSVARNVNDR
jgi:hypothetical protein